MAAAIMADRWNRRRPLVTSIVGTRPEAIKMAPVLRALAARGAVEQQLILTGQHRGLADLFDLPGLPIDNLDLNLQEQTAGEIRDVLREALGALLARRRPDLVLVQGDTSSAYAGALAGKDCGIPLGHVEAGLRSGDFLQPWPEEGHRIRIDALADLLFAPSDAAARNIAGEPAATGTVHVTGNSGIDALLHARSMCGAAVQPSQRKMVLVTCHRRENQGAPLERLADALKRLVRELPLQVVFPLHPNPHLRQTVLELLSGQSDIALIPPVDHQQMVCLIDRSWLILTDSGGLQEEGPALGKPVLVLREKTERQEAIATQNIDLVGTQSNGIVAAVRGLFEDPVRYARMARPSFPFGDGHAAPRIAEIIERYLAPRRAELANEALIRN